METITRREKYLAAIAETMAKSGRNLVLQSGIEHSNSSYRTYTYDLSEDIDPNETYTITLWGELGEGKTYFCPYVGGGSNSFNVLNAISPGIYRLTGKYKDYHPDDPKNLLAIFAMPNTVTGVTSTIHRIKVEKGTVGTDWTPAPEDVTVPTPITRAERYLHYICMGGDENKLPLPITREEQYLHYLARMGVDNLTPAPEDLGLSIPSPITIDERLWYGICGYGTELANASIGGENIALNSGVEVSTAEYYVIGYNLSEDIDPNETYTVTLWGELGEGKEAFGIFMDDGIARFPYAYKHDEGKYMATGKFGHPLPAVSKRHMLVYALFNNVTVNSTISNIKIEKGTVGTDWAPAPSDPGAIRIVTREQQLLWQIYSGITERRKAASASASTTASDEQIGGPEYEEEQEEE